MIWRAWLVVLLLLRLRILAGLVRCCIRPWRRCRTVVRHRDTFAWLAILVAEAVDSDPAGQQAEDAQQPQPHFLGKGDPSQDQLSLHSLVQ